MSEDREPFTLDEQIACVKREIGMRARLYPRWVSAQKMAQAKADEELGCMRAVLATLEHNQLESQPINVE